MSKSGCNFLKVPRSRFLIVLTRGCRGVCKIQVQSHISCVWKCNALDQVLFPSVFCKVDLFCGLFVGWQRRRASWFGVFFSDEKRNVNSIFVDIQHCEQVSFNIRCSQPPLWCWSPSWQGLMMVYTFLSQGWEKVLLFFTRTAGPTLGPWRRVRGGLSRSHSVITCWNTFTMEPGSLCRCLPILRDTGSLLGKHRQNKMLEWCMWKRGRKQRGKKEQEVFSLIWWCSKFQMLPVCLYIKGEGAVLRTLE